MKFRRVTALAMCLCLTSSLALAGKDGKDATTLKSRKMTTIVIMKDADGQYHVLRPGFKPAAQSRSNNQEQPQNSGGSIWTSALSCLSLLLPIGFSAYNFYLGSYGNVSLPDFSSVPGGDTEWDDLERRFRLLMGES